MKLCTVAAVAILATLCCAAHGQQAEWKTWRGPNHNGITAEADWNPHALNSSPRIKWKTDVGTGYSAVSVAGNRLFTMGNIGERDSVVCLDVNTGKENWRHTYPCRRGSYAGPRATPVVDNGRVYSISREAQVFCLDEADGSVKWQRDLKREMKVGIPRWGIAGSARIEGKVAFFNAGKAGVALDKTTGETVWANAPGTGGYSTPVLFATGGKTAIALFVEKHALAVDAATGRILWQHPWETKYDVNAADPVVDGGKVFISSGYKRGCALVDFTSRKPRVVWEHRKLQNHFSTSILHEGHLYGIDGNAGSGTLRCIDLASGEQSWSQRLGFGSLILAGTKLVVLTEKGMLYIAEATPEGYKQYSSGQVLKKKVCWTAPVLCRGMIFCRNSPGSVVCVDVSR
jgi:outer membrane protein assembly factor BamB